MKKFTAIIIVLALCAASLFAMMSCDGKPADTKAPETTAANSEQTTAAEEQTTKAEEQTASEETTAEETTAEETTEEVTTANTTVAEATTAGSGEAEYYEEEVALFEYRDPHTPISAADGRELACKFRLNDGERLIGLILESCPTWQTEGSGFVVELYKWDNDYENTIIGDILYSKEFTDWIDNAECKLDFSDVAETGFPTGTYLWVMRGTTSNVGTWAMDPSDDCEYFENGVSSQNGFRSDAVILSPG